MHILIIPSWYPAHPGDVGGSFFREQAIALQKNGCKVGVIYHQNHSIRLLSKLTVRMGETRFSNDQGVATYRYDSINWFPKMRRLALRFWLRRGNKIFDAYVRLNGRPDVIHAHSVFNGGILAKEISQKNQIPFVLTEHSTAYAREQLSSEDLKLAKKICNASSANLAVSNEFCVLLSQKIQSKREWLFVPNIVNEIFFISKLEEKIEKKFVFINIAFADKKKRQENIIYAFKNEFNEQKNIYLTIGGNGPELETLKSLSKTLNISNQVEFTGALSREQVREKMAASHAFVLSSRYETFGVVVIEALALGLPVIATMCGGPESIVRKEDGILVPVDDVKSLGKAMREIYENSTNFEKEKIRESCRERFSEKAIAKRIIKIYSEVVAR